MTRYYLSILIFAIPLSVVMFDFHQTYWADSKIIKELIQRIAYEESIISDQLRKELESSHLLHEYEILCHYNHNHTVNPDQFVKHALFNIVDEFNTYRTYEKTKKRLFPTLYLHINNRHINHTITIHFTKDNHRLLIEKIEDLQPFLESANEQYLFAKNWAKRDC